MHFLVRVHERFSRGATVDADERGQGPAEVIDDPSISEIALATSEERISLATGGERRGPNMAPAAVSLGM